MFGNVLNYFMPEYLCIIIINIERDINNCSSISAISNSQIEFSFIFSDLFINRPNVFMSEFFCIILIDLFPDSKRLFFVSGIFISRLRNLVMVISRDDLFSSDMIVLEIFIDFDPNVPDMRIGKIMRFFIL